MLPVADLWLPMLVATAFVFVASSVIHMILPIHRGDYGKLPDEEAVMASMRNAGLEPGEYMFPCPSSMKEMGSPETVARFDRGPVGTMTVRPDGVPPIGRALAQWCGYSLLISLFTAYAAAVVLAPGAEGMTVFRLTGTVAMAGYAFSYIPDSIWKGLSWRITFKYLFDGIVYALVTAAAFVWLWPPAA